MNFAIRPLSVLFNSIWRARGIWVRALLCALIGISFRVVQETSDFDLRFAIRGPQPILKNIVIVYLEQNDLGAQTTYGRNMIRSLKEYSLLSDNFYWQSSRWQQLLKQILSQNPKIVGVTFRFSTQINTAYDSELVRTLTDNRILWTSEVDQEGQITLSPFKTSYGYKSGTLDIRPDEDGIVRRAEFPLSSSPSMSIRLAEVITGTSLSNLDRLLGTSQLINFRGPPGLFPSISASDILSQKIPPEFFRDKIVILGSQEADGHSYQTPVGSMTRAEILATSLDNLAHRRWIRKLNLPLSALYIILVTALSTALMVFYPQGVALVFLIWLATALTAISLWVFDSFYFWMPITSSLVTIISTYMVFIGYKLALKENQAWKLEQEKILSTEVEQLKSNFVSMMSHDLKTPIAKIQSICDRLSMREESSPEIREGLENLRKESTELHRYIQTILKISRLESSEVKIRRDATDLNELVEHAYAQVQSLAVDKRQNIELNLEPLFLVDMDAVLIQEVILNLIENAIKYTPTGGTITLKTSEVGDLVYFLVEDSGPGVAMDEQEKVFEKFFRGKAHQSATKGSGLGLFLVKYFVELHGGKVLFENRASQGVRAGFSLPLSAPTTDA